MIQRKKVQKVSRYPGSAIYPLDLGSIMMWACAAGVLVLGSVHLVSTEPSRLSAMATFISGQTPFPELTVVALINDVPVEYYDSNIKEFVSRRRWRANDTIEGLDLKNFAAAQFSSAMTAMIKALNHTAGLYVLQWFASAVLQDDKLATAFFTLAYAGTEILRYNSITNELFAPSQGLVLDDWQKETIKQLYIDIYQPICLRTYKRCLERDKDVLLRKVQPTVRVMRKTEADGAGTRVTCLATGFYPRRVNVTLLRDERPVPDQQLTGGRVLPNGDGTYQLRRSLSVSEEELRDRHRYTCTVTHPSVDNKLDVSWEPEAAADTVLICAVLFTVLGLTALIIIATVLCRRRRRSGAQNGSETSAGMKYTAAHGRSQH